MKRLGPKVKLALLVRHEAGCCKETRPGRKAEGFIFRKYRLNLEKGKMLGVEE